MTSPALQDWFNVATQGLSYEAKQRVCAEIEIKYAVAFREALRDTRNYAAARAWAITTMGDPYSANRSYRQHYGMEASTPPPPTPPIVEPKQSPLQEWLSVATRDLCEAAVARVQQEVEEHVDAARTEAIQSGFDDDAAAAHALTVLGNPRKAQRRFKRSYFTKIELYSIQSITKRRGTGGKLFAALGVMFWIVLIGLSVAGIGKSEGFGDTLRHAHAIIFVTGIDFIPTILGRRFPRTVLVLRSILVPMSMYFMVTAVLESGADQAIHLHNYAPERMEAFSDLIMAGVMTICMVILTPYLWFANWSIISKLRDQHNREAAGL